MGLEGGRRGEVVGYGRCLLQPKVWMGEEWWSGLRLGIEVLDKMGPQPKGMAPRPSRPCRLEEAEEGKGWLGVTQPLPYPLSSSSALA